MEPLFSLLFKTRFPSKLTVEELQHKVQTNAGHLDLTGIVFERNFVYCENPGELKTCDFALIRPSDLPHKSGKFELIGFYKEENGGAYIEAWLCTKVLSTIVLRVLTSSFLLFIAVCLLLQDKWIAFVIPVFVAIRLYLYLDEYLLFKGTIEILMGKNVNR